MHFISTILFVQLLDLFLFIFYNLKLLLELLSQLPSQVTSKSKTLVDNIFFEEDIIEEELIQVTSPLPYLINMLNLHFSKTNTDREKKLNSIGISQQLIMKNLNWISEIQTGIKFWKLKIETLMVLLTYLLKHLTTFLINMHL